MAERRKKKGRPNELHSLAFPGKTTCDQYLLTYLSVILLWENVTNYVNDMTYNISIRPVSLVFTCFHCFTVSLFHD